MKKIYTREFLQTMFDWYNANPRRTKTDIRSHFGVSNTLVDRMFQEVGGIQSTQKARYMHMRADTVGRGCENPSLYLGLSIIYQAVQDAECDDAKLSIDARQFFYSPAFERLAGKISEVVGEDLEWLRDRYPVNIISAD